MKYYTMKETAFLKDTGSKVTVYRHDKTGAKVMTMDNKDPNNVFAVGFRTPPKDHTGVAHIVEHCVLSGSRKYKTKEPFMDLIKTSLQTFLNAMTYPDKTIYPVSSRNKKDFKNLMDVYLDAVFFPAMVEVPEIFFQEGWHYEYDEKKDALTVNGVVYNEMKGVFSDPDAQVSWAIQEHLHPKCTYGMESGGLPFHIPDLTREEFLNFHRTYYHPSNSYIYLYGDGDKEELLSYIHENYLSKFEPLEVDSFPKTNEPFSAPITARSFHTSDKETSDTYYSYSTVLGKSENGKEMLLRDIFATLLVESDSGILKKAFLEKGFGEDIYTETSSSHPLDLSIIVKGAPEGEEETFRTILHNTLEETIKEGIPKEKLRAILRKMEFNLRRGDGPHQGIIFYIRALNSWLYDCSPLESLHFEEALKELYEDLETDNYERYLETRILKNPNSLFLTVSPDKSLEGKLELELEEKLKSRKEGLTAKDLEDIKKAAESLSAYQLSEDSPEAKKTIPLLNLSDVNPKVEEIPRDLREVGGVPLLHHSLFTNGIHYMIFAYPMEHFSAEEYPYANILGILMGSVSTEKYSYEELDTKIDLYTGGVRFGPTIIEEEEHRIQRYFLGTLSVLEQETKRGLDLYEEILLHTELTDEKRIRDLLVMEKSDMESGILPSGHVIALERLRSHTSKGAYLKEKIQGLDFYFFLKELLENWEDRKDSFLSKLRDLQDRIITKQGMVIDWTGSTESMEDHLPFLREHLNRLPEKEYPPKEIPFVPEKKKEAFVLPSQVQYISMGGRFPQGKEVPGSAVVLSNLLSTGYLHNRIRAKGGAYGAGIRIARTGDIGTYSYRDPNLEQTVEVYLSIEDYLNRLSIKEEDLTPLIIGSMNSFDPLLTPSAKGAQDFRRYITGVSSEEISRKKQEALSTTLEDLKNLRSIFTAMERENIVIIGNEQRIKAYDPSITVRRI